MKLAGTKVAILSDQGFEQSELMSPMEALKAAGATVHIVSNEPSIKGWNEKNWGKELDRDVALNDANPEDYNALVIPGGVMNPDLMRRNKAYVAFAQHFLETGKPVATICHGPQLLIETGMLNGRNMTSYASVQTDLKNAGVIWEDKEVVVDNGLVTSRSPEDLEIFNRTMIEEFAEGKHNTTAAFTTSD